jgi:3,4-dehydroadipyl-CoA semialdehyde dehydrogenase
LIDDGLIGTIRSARSDRLSLIRTVQSAQWRFSPRFRLWSRAMKTLQSLLADAWTGGEGAAQPLENPATEEIIAETCATGLELTQGLKHARQIGGEALRALTFAERAKIVGEMSKRIHAHRDELLELAMANGGNTRSDAKFDVDGASGTLAHYAEIGAELGDRRILADGEGVQLGSSPRLAGRHLWLPRHGVAVLINAFNFPAWGFGEKAACALLAGMPVLMKPATSTALVAHRLVEIVADAAPKGAVSMVCGSAHELPGLLEYGDVIAFTGSSATAQKLAALPKVLSREVALNVEADSLNAAVLGEGADDDTYDLFIRDVVKEMTQKTGQKCTAIRRVFVPPGMMERVREDLVERLKAVNVGDPTADGVRMGPVATRQQHRDVLAGIGELAAQTKVVLDGRDSKAGGGKGYFVDPTLLEAEDARTPVVHDLEVFGPVATLLPSPDDPKELCRLVAAGRGGLVCSLYSDDRKWSTQMLEGAGPHHGRLVFGSRKIAGQALFPGTVMPHLLHGGPGRAGGGEELGGLRGLGLYSQRLAVQGDRPLLDAMIGK